MSHRTRGLCLALLGIVVLSPDAMLVRLIEADRWTLLVWRGVFMAVGVAAIALLRPGPIRVPGGRGWAIGLLFAGSTIFFVNSLRMTAAANTLVILAAAPMLAALLSGRVLGEAIERRTWFASGAVVVGLATIFSGSLTGGAPWGDLCALGSATCMAGYLVLARSARNEDLLLPLAGGGLIVAVLALPFADPLAVSGPDLARCFVLGAGVVGLSFILITAGARYLPAPEVGLIMLLEAALGPLWVWLAVGEVPGRETIVGGVLVLGTLAAHGLAGRRSVPA